MVRTLIRTTPDVAENELPLTNLGRLESACRHLDSLGLLVRSFENKSMPRIPVITIDYDPAVLKLHPTHLQGAHYFAMVDGCRIEWVHRDTTLRSIA